MIWLLWKFVSAPVRLALGSVRLTAGIVRVIGIRRLTFLAVGAALGVLFAPATGRELRQKLADQWAETRREVGAKSKLADAVRTELSTNARTWHLPTPTVIAEGARVVLRGAVPDRAARDEMAKVAAAVPGVAAVDNQLAVAAG